MTHSVNDLKINKITQYYTIEEVGQVRDGESKTSEDVNETATSDEATEKNIIQCYDNSRTQEDKQKHEKVHDTGITKKKQKKEEEKEEHLSRSDRLYMLGKQEIAKRRERNYNQVAGEKWNIQFEKSLERKRVLNRSRMNSSPSSSRSRAIRLYELSRPKQIEGKLRRAQLVETAKTRKQHRFVGETASACCTKTTSASAASSICSIDS